MAKRRKKSKRGRRRRSGGAPSWLLAATIAVLALAAIGGLVALTMTTKPGSQKALCALIIDRTNSVNSTQTSSLYSRIASGAVQECSNLDGTLTVWSIGQGGAQSVMAGKFPLVGVGRNGPVRDRSKADNMAAANHAVSTVIHSGAGGGSGGSNIVATMNEAAATMEAQARGSGGIDKYMLVLTDGMQLSDGVSVESLSSITQDPKLLVAQAERVNPQFQLSGVNVSFIGVSSGEVASNGQKLPKWFEQKVRIFWGDLVTDGHGKVCSYQSDQSPGNIVLNCGAT